MSYGQIPEDECIAKITLIYKKGDEKDLKNWRPYSLQQSITKIFMKILQRRIIKGLANEGIMSRMQKGFLKMNGCLEHV